MKKTFILTLGLPALLLAGCTAVEPEVDVTPEPTKTNVVITARIGGPETRVAYFEEPTIDGNNNPIRLIHQQWQVGDVLHGWDDDGNVLNLVVDHVEEGVAYLTVPEDYTMPSEGSIHMIYCGEAEDQTSEAGDWYDLQDADSGTIDFTMKEEDYCPPLWYSFYAEGDEMYSNVFGVMSADATVTLDIQEDETTGEIQYTISADLEFTNQTAFIGFQGFKGLDALPDVRIERISLTGVQGAALVYLDSDDNTLHFEDASATTPVAVDLGWYADENGEIRFPEEKPFLIAVFPREGGDESEEIVLSAHFYTGEDSMDEYDFTKSLGRPEIVAGNFYYVPTKRLVAPPVPSVRVEDDSEEGVHEFTTLTEAFAYINTDAVDIPWSEENNGGAIVTLLRDYTAEGLPDLAGNGNCTFVQFELGEHTLTLDGCSLTADGIESFWIYGGTILQPGDQAALVSNTGFTCLDEVNLIYGGNSGAPIEVSGDGEVDIWGGHYFWITNSPLIGGTSTAISLISGGRFYKKPGTNSCVQVEDDLKIAEDDDPDYPYVCIPQSVYDNVAKTITTTSDGDVVVLKTFSGGPSYQPQKYYIASNNIYLMNDGRLVFEKPNWTGESVYSEDSENRHINLFYSSGSDQVKGIKELLKTQDNMAFGSLYYILQPWEWEQIIWNRSASAVGNVNDAHFLKCEVSDGVQGHAPWRNLIIFPDRFEWPAALAEKNPGQQASTMINKSELSWDSGLKLTVSEAQIMMNAGCVFFPAAGYITPTVSFEDSNNVEARYWSDYEASNPFCMSFNNGIVSSYSWGSQNDKYSVRVAYSAPL